MFERYSDKAIVVEVPGEFYSGFLKSSSTAET
jgi:hypothetical protein